MNNSLIKPIIAFIVCVAITFACARLAAFIQSGIGNIIIETGAFTPEQSEAADEVPVRITYKLYIPKKAEISRPVPAVLAMHGYQNDKDTSAAFCIELARRGIAVLSIDCYGHGDTSPGMRGRGWGKYKITNLDKELSGPLRYMVMITFSILDFFRPDISRGVADSSMGGKSAWEFLGSLPFVDEKRMGVTGHSMGTWASWSVAAAFPGHRAVVLQCGEIFPLDYYDSGTIKFNNVLLLQARYDEFDYFRDYQRDVMGLEKTPLRYRDFMGQDAPVKWNTTYGSMADGSARRMELLQTNHRLVTFDKHSLAVAMNWFTQALDVKTSLADTNHIYMIRETLLMLAMFAAMASMLPLFLIITRIKFFRALALPLAPKPKLLSPKNRWITVITAILISGITFPIMTQLGHGLFPFPENIFRMTIGNGFIVWLDFLMLISLSMLLYWYKKGNGKKSGWALSDLGLEGMPDSYLKATKLAYKPDRLIFRAIIAAFILTGTMYIMVCICSALYNVDFRFIWPMFRPFTGLRFCQFWVYLPFYAAFFTVNSGIRLYGQLRFPEISHNGRICGIRTQLVWWGYSVLVMLGGVILIALLEYIPFFLGFGPGADLLLTPLFGGPFMSIMILLVPQFAIFFFISTWLYRKSGTVYTGSFVLAILATWVLTGGSAIL